MALQLGDPKQALISINQALSINASVILWEVHKACILNVLGEEKLLHDLVAEIKSKTIDDTKTCAEFAMLLNRTNDYLSAQTYYQKAIKLSPNESQLYFNLASIQRYLGHVKDSEKNLDKVIALDPRDSEAYLLRSSLRRQTVEDNHIAEIEKAIAVSSNRPVNNAQLHYSLAKELEDVAAYEKSIKILNIGAKFQRDSIQYDPNTDLNIIRTIIEVYGQELIKSKPSGFEDDSAVFILGLPRTGSTLVERIISSHDDVHSAGELNNFAIEMMKQCKVLVQGQAKSRTEIVELTSKLDFDALGRDYISSVPSKTTNKKKFIDKLPLNSLNVGLIHLALPNAKIIHVERHPMDTCYSMYKHLFNNGYPFSYSLPELANYYIAHHQLMNHWKIVLPKVIHSVKYEHLVNNLESESKKLIDYCGLAWQEQCLDFHLNKKPAVTASSTQVRSSAYTSSINKWLNYKDELQELKSRLEIAGIDCA